MDWLRLVDAVKHAAEQEVPFEACGLLDEQGFLVACTNSAPDRTRAFLISPEEFTRVARGRCIAGVYHSHVDQGAYISDKDQAGMTFNGLYIVASVIRGVAGEVKAWIYKDSKFTPVLIPGRQPQWANSI